jgi:hypothetical protein
MLTRKYYVAIAAVLKARANPTVYAPDYVQAVRDVARDLAGQFGLDNPNFDRERFLKAAGAA